MVAPHNMVKAKLAVQSLKPYVNGSHSRYLIQNHRKILKLDSNEATISPSPKVLAALVQYLQEGPLNWYPDIDSSELCDHLSVYTRLPSTFILTFNGSDHALETVARAFLSRGDEVIFFAPTYDHFRVYAESCEAVLVAAPETNGLTLLERLEQSVTSQTKMVYLVNPNNPTGELITRREIESAVSQFDQVLFVVDEAYFEFCSVTVADLVLEHKNIIVTRSFSKAFGLAGLRCGYLLAQPVLCNAVSKIRVGKNINALAQVAATAALQDLEHMRRYVEEVRDVRDWIVKKFSECNITTRITPANFILVKIAEPAKVLAFLESHNIYIRDRSAIPQLKGFLRLTIGDKLSMKRFWKVFETIPIEWLTTQPQEAQINSKDA